MNLIKFTLLSLFSIITLNISAQSRVAKTNETKSTATKTVETKSSEAPKTKSTPIIPVKIVLGGPGVAGEPEMMGHHTAILEAEKRMREAKTDAEREKAIKEIQAIAEKANATEEDKIKALYKSKETQVTDKAASQPHMVEPPKNAPTNSGQKEAPAPKIDPTNLPK
jgi:type IV secretory pathway VirB10-like protein